MVSPQMSSLVEVALLSTAIFCLSRVLALKLGAIYPALVFFLSSQIATTFCTYIADVRTQAYAFTYIVLVILEWLAYGLMIRELHNSIFAQFPGIAVVGRWAIYGALGAIFVVFVLGITSVEQKVSQLGTILVAVEFASHCLFFGFAAFILMILAAISKYPIDLDRNIVVNCAFFSLILLGEAAGLIIDQGTSRHYTTTLNLAVSGLEALCFIIWPLRLSREGHTTILRVRRDYTPDDEARLLHQLSTVNSLLLRAARK